MKKCVLLLILVLTTGCKVGPNYRMPELPLPEGWNALGQAWDQDRNIDPGCPFKESDSLPPIWELFDDPLLSRYLRELGETNLDIKLAEAKVCEALALRRVASSKLYPSIDGRVRYVRARPAGGVLNGQDVIDPLNPSGGEILGGIPLNLLQQTFLADFDAVWEIDLFGKTQRQIESACAYIQMQEEARRGAYVMVTAEFARIYLELRGVQRSITLAKRQLALLEKRIKLIQERVVHGLERETAWIGLEGDKERLMGELSDLEAREPESFYRLAVLMGKNPETLVRELAEKRPLPEIKSAVPSGVPSDLLRRRPDIREAERQIAQATAEVGVAVGDLFPQIRIDGSYGFENLHLGQLKGAGESWSYGAGLLTPLFRGGKIRANIDRQKWVRSEAFISYEQTVLQALEEVESSLARAIKTNEGAYYLKASFERQQELFGKQEHLYEGGLSNRQQTFEVEQRMIDSERNWIDQEVKSRVSLIALYKALGGGWESECEDECGCE